MVSFNYLSDLLFLFFAERESTIPPNEEIIRQNVYNIGPQSSNCDF